MYLGEVSIPVGKLQGIGPSLCSDLNRLGIRTVQDLLLHLPRGYEDRSHQTPLHTVLQQGGRGFVNTVAFIEGHEYFGFGFQKTLKILIRDSTAAAELVCYGRNFLGTKFPPGMQVRVAGIFTYQYRRLQSSSFDIEDAKSASEDFSTLLPIYPLSGRLSQKVMRKILRQAYTRYGAHVQDELPDSLRNTYALLPVHEALRAIHFPKNTEESETALKSLAFRELFSFQLEVVRRSLERKVSVRSPRNLPLTLRDRAIHQLPFSLTPDQVRSLKEIDKDIEGTSPMARLLQGDVGAGKTLVAFLSALRFAEAGFQTALMAPTELLARQHADNAARLLEPLGVRLAFYSGKLSAKLRKPLLRALEEGEVDIVIGTHALFSEDVRFHRLGFVVIDEQHRFGVSQRQRLSEKGEYPDLLVMSATPIPRTLALSVFGDLEVSELKTLPPGRKPIQTHLSRIGNEEKVYSWVEHELAQGHQAYFVYPLIEGDGDLKDAESMFQQLKTSIFSRYQVGLIHARLPEEDQRSIMEAFVQNKINVLVATSIVEVGVDVPNATCMVIEHAERFGLSALHQLRGRIGRGKAQGYAFLVYDPNLTDLAKERLKVLKETTDGFRIAEEDLRLRGPGDMIGVRQSGMLDFSIAQLPRDLNLMVHARKEAFHLLETDPGLLLPKHEGLRVLMGLKEKEAAGGIAP